MNECSNSDCPFNIDGDCYPANQVDTETSYLSKKDTWGSRKSEGKNMIKAKKDHVRSALNRFTSHKNKHCHPPKGVYVYTNAIQRYEKRAKELNIL